MSKVTGSHKGGGGYSRPHTVSVHRMANGYKVTSHHGPDPGSSPMGSLGASTHVAEHVFQKNQGAAANKHIKGLMAQMHPDTAETSTADMQGYTPEPEQG